MTQESGKIKLYKQFKPDESKQQFQTAYKFRELIKTLKNQKDKKKVWEKQNNIKVHKAGAVQFYFISKNRGVSVAYQFKEASSEPNYEEPAEIFYWDISEMQVWKKIFSFKDKKIKLIKNFNGIPEGFIMDEKVRLFSQAEVEFNLDLTQGFGYGEFTKQEFISLLKENGQSVDQKIINEIFKKDYKLNFYEIKKAALQNNYKFQIIDDYSEEERIFGPFPNKLFFKSLSCLKKLRGTNEIKKSLEYLAKFVVYPQGYTLLSYLVKKDNKKLIKELFESTKEIRFVRDRSGNTPLNYALANQNYEAINSMLIFLSDNSELIPNIINQNDLIQIIEFAPTNWKKFLDKCVINTELVLPLQKIKNDTEQTYLLKDFNYALYSQNKKEILKELTDNESQKQDKDQVVVKQFQVSLDFQQGQLDTLLLMKMIYLFEDQDIFKCEFIINFINYKWQKNLNLNRASIMFQFLQSLLIFVHSFKPGQKIYLYLILVSSFIYFYSEISIYFRLKALQPQSSDKEYDKEDSKSNEEAKNNKNKQ